MPDEQGRSPPCVGGGENSAEEPAKTVYFVPIYAVAVVDPNKHVGKSRHDQRQWIVGSSDNVEDSQSVSPVTGCRGKVAESEAAVQQKRQKLIVMRKRGRIPEYDDDDPHKPTPKRLRNRMKAQKSRDKKKAYINGLEIKVKELENTNSELEERCLSLQVENETLKNEVLESDAGAKENLLRYYERLRKDEQNTVVQNQEGTSGKSSENQDGNPRNEIADREGALEAEIDEESILETVVGDQEHLMEKLAEINDDQEGTQHGYVSGEFADC